MQIAIESGAAEDFQRKSLLDTEAEPEAAWRFLLLPGKLGENVVPVVKAICDDAHVITTTMTTTTDR